MRIGTDSNLKSISLVNIAQRAFNLPKAHLTGFLAALSIILNNTSSFDEQDWYSSRQYVVNGYAGSTNK